MLVIFPFLTPIVLDYLPIHVCFRGANNLMRATLWVTPSISEGLCEQTDEKQSPTQAFSTETRHQGRTCLAEGSHLFSC